MSKSNFVISGTAFEPREDPSWHRLLPSEPDSKAARTYMKLAPNRAPHFGSATWQPGTPANAFMRGQLSQLS